MRRMLRKALRRVARARRGSDRWLWPLAQVFHDPASPQDVRPDLRGAVRAHHLYTISRLTPVLMIANVINALAFLLVLDASGQLSTGALVWAGVALVFAIYFLTLWALRRNKPFPPSLSVRTGRKAAGYAAMLGLVWAYPGFALLPDLTGPALAFVVALSAGMSCGGAISLYPVPLAALGYSGAIAGGTLIGVARMDDAAFVGFTLVTLSFFFVIVRGIRRHYATFTSEFIRRAELDDRNRTITRLLQESEASAVAQRRNSERKLAQAQKMEAVGQLTGGIAHDFNNLLTVIRGNTELLEIEAGVDRSLTQPILDAAARGADLTQRLLAFARRQTLAPKSLDLDRLVSEMLPLLRRSLGSTIDVRLMAEPQLWHVLADPAQVESALLNLALNARDAMPEGGTLTLDCRNVSLGEGDGRLDGDALPGDYVVLTVGDTGHGMSAATQARALEPFFTTKEVGKGSGLGLPMVYGFTKQSGGFLTVGSAEGEGTNIRIYLPRTESPAVGLGESAPAAPEAGRREHVLLVEDDEEVRELVTRLLVSLNYSVHAVPDVKAARRALQAEPPALVLTDVVLPGGVSGADFAEELRQRHPGLPVIFMSGYPAAAVSRVFLQPGQVLLKKPFGRRKIAEAVRRAMATV